MKEATNILRKALGSNPTKTSYQDLIEHFDTPAHWADPEDHKEFQLLNQPEHQAQGWFSWVGFDPKRIMDEHRIHQHSPHNVKAVELRSSHHEPGRYHHIIYENPHQGATPRSPKWKITHVDTHTGEVVGESRRDTLEGAIKGRNIYHTSRTSSKPPRNFPKARITKIHYHDT